MFGLENRGIPREALRFRLDELTEELHLSELRGRNIFELSGGEKQKIAFSSVYASAPDVLVFDEPSSNLDMKAIGELADLIQRAKISGKTILIAEHRIWYLMDIVDRVVYMQDGRIASDMEASAFKALPEADIRRMGLRVRDLSVSESGGVKTIAADGLLSAQKISVRLGGRNVLNDISFQASRGEIIAIAGVNGAGKSTLARMLCGLQKNGSGTVLWTGKPMSRRLRRKKAYMVIAIPLFMLMIIVALLPLLIGVYVYRDAKRRGMNAALWTLIAILAPSLIGFIIYLLVRGNYSNLKCPRCAATVTEQYVVCPKCGAKLKPSCPNCSAPVEPDWTVCPKCAQPLPTVQEDIVTPVQPKDKTLWKILAAIIIVPVVLLLVLGLSFSAASGGGSSSLREVSFDEYYADQELPESTKEYVRNWLGEINPRTDHVYALRYTYRFNPNSETTDYYYLIYVPGGGDVDRRGFGYSTGLFSTAFKLELEGTNDQDGLYCVMTTSKKAAPQLRVTLNGKRLEDEITVVDFNPTLYTIASESDYSMLTNAAGDLYLEQLEKEMEPDLVAITVVEDGQGVATGEFDAPDFLLNTVTGIHELHYLEEYPFSLENFQLSDYFTLSVHYADTTGEAHYEDTSNYLIVETESAWYLIEIGPNSVIEKILEEGQITSRDDVLVYEISEDAYSELANLFDKTT